MEGFLTGISVLLDPYILLMVLLGTIGGIIVGILPGIGSTMAIALLLPFTVVMEPIPALAVLASLFSANAYSGAIPAILVNTPGSGSSTVTCWDGYPMAKRGEAGKALGMATVASLGSASFAAGFLLGAIGGGRVVDLTSVPVAFLLGAAVMVFGGTVFLVSTVTTAGPRDWLVALLIHVYQNTMAELLRSGVDLWQPLRWLHAILPPMHRLGAGTGGADVLHAGLYGAGLVALALLVLDRRPLGGGARD